MSHKLLSVCSGPEHHGSWELNHAASNHAELDVEGDKRLREDGLLGGAAAAGDGRSSAPAPALRPVEELQSGPSNVLRTSVYRWHQLLLVHA